MHTKTSIQNAGSLLLVIALAACGGGGGSDASKNPPTLSTQPQNQSALTDATATFSVTATGNGLSYQWQRNGTPIAGAVAANYTTPAATYLDSGAQYTVVVSNADGSVTSGAAQLSLSLSADQQAFESLNLAPSAGSVVPHWNLNGRPGSNPNRMGFARAGVAMTRSKPSTPSVEAVGPSGCGHWMLIWPRRSTKSITHGCWNRSDRSLPGT